jgi:hypothetical protein
VEALAWRTKVVPLEVPLRAFLELHPPQLLERFVSRWTETPPNYPEPNYRQQKVESDPQHFCFLILTSEKAKPSINAIL